MVATMGTHCAVISPGGFKSPPHGPCTYTHTITSTPPLTHTLLFTIGWRINLLIHLLSVSRGANESALAFPCATPSPSWIGDCASP